MRACSHEECGDDSALFRNVHQSGDGLLRSGGSAQTGRPSQDSSASASSLLLVVVAISHKQNTNETTKYKYDTRTNSAEENGGNPVAVNNS